MWQSKTLKDLFSAQFQFATDMIAEVNGKISDLAPIEAKIQEMLSEAQAAVASAQALLTDLAGSGVYAIALSPGMGSWTSRLSGATGAPPVGGSVYSAAMLSIFVGTSPSAISSAYTSMKDSLTEPIRIDEPTLPPMAKPSLGDEGESNWLDEDEWKSKTVGDLFPGQLVAAKSAMNEAQKLLTLAQNAKDAFDGRKAKLTEALAASQAVVDSMSNTGVYYVLVEPGPGDWMARISAESGAPPVDNTYFCAGMASVVQAADLSVVTSAWGKLIGAMA